MRKFSCNNKVLNKNFKPSSRLNGFYISNIIIKKKVLNLNEIRIPHK